MIQISEDTSMLAFNEIATGKSDEIKAALAKLLDELTIPYEFGYLAEFWNENTQFKLVGYINEPPENVKDVYDMYYRYDATTGQYQTRSFHRASTLFKYLLKGRKHPLAPELIPDFFTGEKSRYISGELKRLFKDKGITSFGPAIFMPYVGNQGRYLVAMLKLDNQNHFGSFYIPSSLVGFAACSKSLVSFVQSDDPAWQSVCWILGSLKDSLGRMHDTIVHTLNVMSISLILLSRLKHDNDWITDSVCLKVRSAALGHDLGKKHSLPEEEDLEVIDTRIYDVAKDMSSPGRIEEKRPELTKLRRLFKSRRKAQERYDRHAILSVRDILRERLSCTDQDGWEDWLVPILCHHYVDKPKLKVVGDEEQEVDLVRDYLKDQELGYCNTVGKVYENIDVNLRLLVETIALADKIEDYVGFKVHRQSRMAPSEAIEHIVSEYTSKFSKQMMVALNDCAEAIISLYYKYLEL